MLSYRKQFRPGALAKPHAILAVAAVCADTDAEADRLATTIDLNFVRRSQRRISAARKSGRSRRLSTTRRWTASASATTATRLFVGAPATVRARLTQLVEATQADEVMITTMVYDHAARKHSYELMAREFGLKAPTAAEVEASQA